MKALLGPTNYANQAMLLTRALQGKGVDASHVLYLWRDDVPYGYAADRVVRMNADSWLPAQLSVVGQALGERTDVFHLWNRTLVSPPGPYGFLSGFDLPFLKGSGAKVVFSFTGYDVRRSSLDMHVNPSSPLRRGLESPYEERIQEVYLDYLRDWVDRFVVTDPELQAFFPEAEVIPRGVDLSTFRFVGVGETSNPLVVHAPSDRKWKGTDVLLSAVENLRRKGVRFEFKLIEGMDHAAALECYRRADVVVDQLLIGWYGVLAVEAMALGKPVVVYVRKPLDEAYGPGGLPIVNTTVEEIERDLERVIRDLSLRLELSERGRAFAEAVHDVDKVADATARLYEDVARDAAPAGPKRLEYFLRLARDPSALAGTPGTARRPVWRRLARRGAAFLRRVRRWGRRVARSA